MIFYTFKNNEKEKIKTFAKNFIFFGIINVVIIVLFDLIFNKNPYSKKIIEHNRVENIINKNNFENIMEDKSKKTRNEIKNLKVMVFIIFIILLLILLYLLKDISIDKKRKEDQKDSEFKQKEDPTPLPTDLKTDHERKEQRKSEFILWVFLIISFWVHLGFAFTFSMIILFFFGLSPWFILFLLIVRLLFFVLNYDL